MAADQSQRNRAPGDLSEPPTSRLHAVDTASPEQFALSRSKLEIIRTVTRRAGTSVVTRARLDQIPRIANPSQSDLAAMMDLSFLRAPDWPATSGVTPHIRIVDIFSGCGIMTLGVWEAARALGIRLAPVAALDTNLTALAVYEANFPDVRSIAQPVEDIIDGRIGAAATSSEKAFLRSIGQVDLLVGGPPCQGHSNLNNHTRRHDPKNRLYERMARFAELAGPRHVLIENVSTVRNDHGRVVDKTIAALERLGYKVDQATVEVSSLGVAQRRRRHVVVASLTQSIRIMETAARFCLPPRPIRWAIGDLQRVRPSSLFDTPPAANPINRKRIDWLFDHDKHDLPDRLRPDCHRLKEHSYTSVYGRMFWDRPSQTITRGYGSMGQGRYVHPRERRTITPHEAARLQFIPDFFRFPKVVTRRALADMIGNAVPTKLTYALALDLLR